ncbi:MAG: metal ABC transporter substrate-binding protein [Candidatus Gracilibacteria bacterium]|nr:metal ABC transporter substrate-binding protein [Candidatus Gracilibacteria bacterium]
MKKTIIIIFNIIFLFSCSSGNKIIEKDLSKDKKVIYTSFYPIYFVVKSLIGNESEVINIVPNGGEPHEYEPNLRQIGEMKKADLIIMNGLGIESYENKLRNSLTNINFFIIGNNIKNLLKLEKNQEVYGNIDPHIWLSPKMYLDMSNLLIIELEKNGYKNLDKSIITKLENLDKDYSAGLKNCFRKEIITSHKAFGYLARDYGFVQYAIFGISPEEEPSVKSIADTIDLIKKQKLKYIFSENYISPKFANTIKNETQVEVLNLNPVETLSDSEKKSGENYISIMQRNLELLKKGLECK